MTRTMRALVGLGLVGYGLLIVLQVLAHEALFAGLASLAIGGLLLATGVPDVRVHRARLVGWLGAGTVGGVLLYNLATRSGLILPEWGILLYGVALLVAARFLDRKVGRVEVGSLVGWSFPLLLAPLLLFALNAVLTGQSGAQAGSAAQPVVIHLLVLPTAFGLNLLGTPAEVVRDNLILETSNGSLALGIGLVCAGLYPIVLFVGVLGLHAWHERLPARRFAAYLGVGTLGLYLANLVRLVLLAKVGQRWGGEALQTAHAHLGWILFAVFMALFWVVVLRRIEAPRAAPPAPAEETE